LGRHSHARGFLLRLPSPPPFRAARVGGGGTALRAPVYSVLPVDLRLPPATSLAPLLSRSAGGGASEVGDDNDNEEPPLLSPTLPTLLLFECVLAYMDPVASNALIRWFVDYFAAPPAPGAGSSAAGAPLGGVVYEMFKLNDAFGRVMLNNLKVRACAAHHHQQPSSPS